MKNGNLFGSSSYVSHCTADVAVAFAENNFEKIYLLGVD